jgi:hypothetical protein
MPRLAIVLVLLGAFLTMTAASAGAVVRIDRIQYDSSGPDDGSNTSLNAEWIRLENTGSKAVKLKGWSIRDAAGHVYRFGTFSLFAHNLVTIHTGHGSNSSHHRYWGSGSYIWNNDGDTATLKRANGPWRISVTTRAAAPR